MTSVQAQGGKDMRGSIFAVFAIALFAASMMPLGVRATAAEGEAAQDKSVETGCPDRVDHVLLEQGHLKHFPVLLAPDNDVAGPQIWGDLDTSKSSDRGLDEITVHCFYNKAETKKTDVLLPKNIKKCTLSAGKFSCELRS